MRRWILLASIALVGCGSSNDSSSSPTDAAADATIESGSDATTDAKIDGTSDAPTDAPIDSPIDATSDAPTTACDDAPPPLPKTTGKTIHLAPTGNDATGDGSTAKPYATPEKAAASASAGDAIELADGTYAIAKAQWLPLKGTAAAPIVIKAAAGAHPILDGTTMTGTNPLLTIGQGAFVVVDSLEVRNTPGAGISTYESDHVTIERCHVHHVKTEAIDAIGTNLLIAGNEMHDAVLENQDAAMEAAGGGWAATTATWHFSDGTNSSNVQWIGNHIHDSWGECLITLFVDGAVVRGNRIHDCWSETIYVDHGKNVRIERNLLYSTTDKYNRSSKTQRAQGVGFAVEHYASPPPFADENVIVANNVIDGVQNGIDGWYDATNDVPENTYRGVKILFNVIHGVRGAAMTFAKRGAGSSAPTGNVFAGNVAYAAAGTDAVVLPAIDVKAWTFADDDYPEGVPAIAKEPGSFPNDPLLVAPDVATTGADGFHLESGSACAGAAHALTDVPQDFVCATRSTPKTNMGIFAP